MSDYLERSTDLGNAVWMRRERELGLSREALAKRLGWSLTGDGTRSGSGWSPKTIARLERAERGIASRVELNRLAQCLDLTPEELTGRISQASAPRTGEAGDLQHAIAQVEDPHHRAILERIAGDLAGLARSLAGRGPRAADRGHDPDGH